MLRNDISLGKLVKHCEFPRVVLHVSYSDGERHMYVCQQQVMAGLPSDVVVIELEALWLGDSIASSLSSLSATEFSQCFWCVRSPRSRLTTIGSAVFTPVMQLSW
jgi:hypothetical protein